LKLLFSIFLFICFCNGGGTGPAPVVTAATFSPSTPASSGGAVGTVACSANCGGIAWSITGGNSSGDFQINSSTGAITFTAQGQTDWNGASALQNASLTVQASNGQAGNNTITVNGYSDGSVNAPSCSAQLPNSLHNGGVSFLRVTAGSGYTDGTGYSLTFSGGGGSGAAGTVDVVGGLIVNAVVTNAGSGYTSNPTVTLPAGIGPGSLGAVTAAVYQTRPPWKVAGTDYCVGYASAPIKTAGVDTPPTCVTQNATAHKWTINADNCVIDGWDFTGGGGWQIIGCNTSSNPTITNSKFLIGTNLFQPVLLQGAQNSCTDAAGLTFSNNVIDGANLNWGGVGSSAGGGGLLQIQRGGTQVYKYNLIKNSGADLVDAVGGSLDTSTALTVKYNVMMNDGQADGCSGASLHPDWLVTGNLTYNTPVIDFNFVIQTTFPCGAGGGGTQGMTLDSNGVSGTVFNGGEASFNVMIAAATQIGNQSYGQRFAPGFLPNSATTFTSAYNYVDPSGLTNQSTNPFTLSNSGTCGTSCIWTLNNNASLIGTTPSTWNTNQHD